MWKRNYIVIKPYRISSPFINSIFYTGRQQFMYLHSNFKPSRSLIVGQNQHLRQIPRGRCSSKYPELRNDYCSKQLLICSIDVNALKWKKEIKLWNIFLNQWRPYEEVTIPTLGSSDIDDPFVGNAVINVKPVCAGLCYYTYLNN